ncbi:MAG: hypothetical protein IKZ28_06040 [Clostridia bacterium]|nr:hypothetical protein [Clostridia bacterium]
MSKMKKQQQQKKILLDNLAYIRLREALKATDGKIEGNKPLQKEEGEGFLSSVEGLWTNAKNLFRGKKTARFEKEKEEIADYVKTFEAEKGKTISLADDLAKMKKLLAKYVKEDADGNKKTELLLLACMDERGGVGAEYAFPAFAEIFGYSSEYVENIFESFCENLNALLKNGAERWAAKLVQGLDGAVESAGETLALDGTAIWSVWDKQKRARKLGRAWQVWNEDEKTWEFALLLSKIQTSEKDGIQVKIRIDELLKRVEEYRGDSAYVWFAEGEDEEMYKGAVSLCNLCIERLATIMGR